MAKGVLIINLGTTAAPTEEKVRVYLKEFLMDKLVIDIPFLFRWILVNLIILRTRPGAVAKLYQKVWLKEGSPLLHYSLEFEKKLKSMFESDVKVALGMRYGAPSIATSLKELKDVDSLVVLPLYPQFSLAATQSSIDEVKRVMVKESMTFPVKFVPAFYNSNSFIKAFAEVAKPYLGEKHDHVLFSFHGLPERQVSRTETKSGYCTFSDQCCGEVSSSNQNCYRAQCFSTAREIAKILGLPENTYTVSFQSRLGRTPWIKPHSDVLYEELPKKGIRRLLVLSPSFVADCLETLEEIAIRGREQFIAAGGEELIMVPSLNATPAWVSAAFEIISKWI